MGQWAELQYLRGGNNENRSRRPSTSFIALLIPEVWSQGWDSVLRERSDLLTGRCRGFLTAATVGEMEQPAMEDFSRGNLKRCVGKEWRTVNADVLNTISVVSSMYTRM